MRIYWTEYRDFCINHKSIISNIIKNIFNWVEKNFDIQLFRSNWAKLIIKIVSPKLYVIFKKNNNLNLNSNEVKKLIKTTSRVVLKMIKN